MSSGIIGTGRTRSNGSSPTVVLPPVFSCRTTSPTRGRRPWLRLSTPVSILIAVLTTRNRLPAALSQGLVDESALDRSLVRQFSSLIRLGYFDGPEAAYRNLSATDVNSEHAQGLALRAAQKGITLLKNDGPGRYCPSTWPGALSPLSPSSATGRTLQSKCRATITAWLLSCAPLWRLPKG